MERSSALCLAGLLACTAHLTASLDTSPALQRPGHLSVVALIICGAALVLLEKIRPLRSRSAGKEQQYAPIPLSDLAEGNSSRPTSPVQADTPVPEYRPKLGLKLYCALVVFLICCRVEILRQVMNAIECATSSMETAVPVLITLADWWLVQRKRQPPREEDDDDMDSTVYGDLLGRIAASNWRPLVTAVLLSWSSSAVLTSASPAASTYICSHVSREYSMIPRLQVAGLILDGFLSVLLFLLLDSSSRCSWSFGPMGAVSLGLSCLLSASIWILIAAGIYAWGPANYRMLISPTPMFFTSSAIKLAVELSIAVVCALHTIRAIGLSNTSILVLFTSAYTSLFLSTWNHSHPFPPLSGGMVLALTALVIGMIIHSIPLSSDFDGARTSRPRSFSRLWGFYPILAVLYFFQLMLVYHGDNEVRYHPIDALVYDAKERHDAWLKWASNSSSVEIAAADYTARYKRHPPPHFDEWYAYAVEHSSRIINDFDSIHEDLLPYWSLSPAEIRQRTWDSIADPSKGIGGILIRDGKAHIAPNVPRNQRLMLDGIIKMIEQFGQWLPDMDLAFNLNNECRVAIPYEEMESARSDAVSALANEKPPSELTNAFSDGRADGWHQLPDDEHNSEHFVTLSSRSIWDEFGSITCPPDSPARTQSLWNRRDYCASCALPHSLGAFFANSTLAADICHQPDLANLHGFYTSPNVFIGTNSLIPIFSQSKAPGFNDILYPSAWNYMDRVPYAANDEHRDPPFDDKKPTIFWRGATTEGFAAPDSTAWHGMTRQRMVHALSITSAPQTLPLPHPVAAYKRKLRYAAVPAPALRASIPLDVAVSDVVRCAEPACAAERALLRPLRREDRFPGALAPPLPPRRRRLRLLRPLPRVPALALPPGQGGPAVSRVVAWPRHAVVALCARGSAAAGLVGDVGVSERV